jgi:hypothetical protein
MPLEITDFVAVPHQVQEVLTERSECVVCMAARKSVTLKVLFLGGQFPETETRDLETRYSALLNFVQLIIIRSS